MMRIGIDIGSTTVKLVAIDALGNVLFSRYVRHHAKAVVAVCDVLNELQAGLGDIDIRVCVTGSVGMGISERMGLPFAQEVVAAAKAIKSGGFGVRTMIDIGGEDAKIVFFKGTEASDLRMNGNCAGGTGAFIDQMAVILGTDVGTLGKLALESKRVYPIASRCGVFCKTDIQNLIAKNVPREDIAASIFHAVAVQTVVTLAHGCDIEGPVLFCGGPLTFIPALRKAFMEYLKLPEKDVVIPQHGTLLPALGSALSCDESWKTCRISQLAGQLKKQPDASFMHASGLQPVFKCREEYEGWKKRISSNRMQVAQLRRGWQDVFIGIDSGSTTTKIVVTDMESRILFTYYNANNGNPVEAVERGLRQLEAECRACGAELCIKGSCSTGYGEDLVKKAFGLDAGIVETIAHYEGARYMDKDVSFILDIGGQDMKAIFVDNGVVNRIEINEACSSGCGSFIETFAKTLGYTVGDFSLAACRSGAPCDLGTRCTVFMNSKVKQVLREGATVEDIAAGLAYSVVKNCLYKVLKLKDISALGKNIVVQGGAMRNDAVVRALEIMADTTVTRCDCPELMGAFGCSLYAKEHAGKGVPFGSILAKAGYSSDTLHCKGCDNRCLVSRYIFGNGKKFYSGNRCEKVFNNGECNEQGANAYQYKERLLFNRVGIPQEEALMTIGIPRCLNIYENYPFWHALFSGCGIRVCMSGNSDFAGYEQSARMVMSDNICFPAKLVHSHIQDLAGKKVDRIFMPYVIFEKKGNGQNSYNCPIVTGYSDVVKSVQHIGIPIDSPPISFKDKKLLYKQCRRYLEGLGIGNDRIKEAFESSWRAQEEFEHGITGHNKEILRKAGESKRLVILLAGRPYHTDPLIQHRVSDMIASMGVDVITDDIVREEAVVVSNVHFLGQWGYPNRILEAAQWCASQDANVQFVEMTSFGCGPDAFLVDEVREILARHGKSLTLLKLDDINNVGSMKLRVRSLTESLKISNAQKVGNDVETTETGMVACPGKGYLHGKKILVPYFTPFISPLIPAVMSLAGYEVENLPLSDTLSSEYGLKYANNEVCYPATLIVGDVVKAFKSKKYDSGKCAVAMVQTGGQCRASNYVALIKKALADAGYPAIPVVSLTFGGAVDKQQEGLEVNWLKLLPVALRAILFSDCISKFYYASAVREKEPGLALQLKDRYLHEAAALIRSNRSKELYSVLADAACRFDEICLDVWRPRVGVVGEIFLKFNTFAHKGLTGWLTERKIEVVPSVLTDFFMQSFVNEKVRTESDIKKKDYPAFLYKWIYNEVWKQVEKVNDIASSFRFFMPFKDIFEEAEEARKIVSLNAQFGEGWLLPAEVAACAGHGINNVISLQPFGCIANHIVSKGIEKRVKKLFPDINMLSLDFDSGVSDVNITNRVLLFVENLKKIEYDLQC